MQGNVDEIVAVIDEGKADTDYNPNDYAPYIFAREKDGMLVAHPKLQQKRLNTEKYMPVCKALVKPTPEGVWVDYEWDGAMKKS